MKRLASVLLALWVLAATQPSMGQSNARVSDIARFKGPRINRLQGYGLVVGLAGTGDSADYRPTIEALASLIGKYAGPVLKPEDLKDTKSVAIVFLQAVLPANGTREGDRLDVQVATAGSAKSLLGGRLVATPMQHHSLVDRTITGFAMGPLELLDPNTQTKATIRQGLVLERDVMMSYIAKGSELHELYDSPWIQADQRYVTLVIDEAHSGFGMTTAIAEVINAALGISYADTQLARAMDAKNVVIRIPEVQAGDPVPWLRDIETLTPLLPERGARILVNRKSGFIGIDGEVRISPVMFSVKGLTITVVRSADGQIQTPAIERHNFVTLDPGNQGGSTLDKLVRQLDQIKVPIEDRILVIEELQRMGKIHAIITYEE